MLATYGNFFVLSRRNNSKGPEARNYIGDYVGQKSFPAAHPCAPPTFGILGAGALTRLHPNELFHRNRNSRAELAQRGTSGRLRVGCRNTQYLSCASLHKAGAVGTVVKAAYLLIKCFSKLTLSHAKGLGESGEVRLLTE